TTARADGIALIRVGLGRLIGPPTHERPQGRAEGKDLQRRPEHPEQPLVDVDHRLVRGELHHAVPRTAAQRGVYSGPNPGPVPHLRHAPSGTRADEEGTSYHARSRLAGL